MLSFVLHESLVPRHAKCDSSNLMQCAETVDLVDGFLWTMDGLTSIGNARRVSRPWSLWRPGLKCLTSQFALLFTAPTSPPPPTPTATGRCLSSFFFNADLVFEDTEMSAPLVCYGRCTDGPLAESDAKEGRASWTKEIDWSKAR